MILPLYSSCIPLIHQKIAVVWLPIPIHFQVVSSSTSSHTSSTFITRFLHLELIIKVIDVTTWITTFTTFITNKSIYTSSTPTMIVGCPSPLPSRRHQQRLGRIGKVRLRRLRCFPRAAAAGRSGAEQLEAWESGEFGIVHGWFMGVNRPKVI